MRANLDSDLPQNNDQSDTDQRIAFILSELALLLKPVIIKDEFLEMVTGIKAEINALNKTLSLLQKPSKHPLDNDILTSAEVMKMFKICKRTLQNRRDSGKIPFYTIGRKIYYR